MIVLTQDDVKRRAKALVLHLKKEGLTQDDALNLCNIATFIMIVAMADSHEDAHAGVDAAALSLHDGIDTLKPEHFEGMVTHGTA